jgi:hypothetical protein
MCPKHRHHRPEPLARMAVGRHTGLPLPSRADKALQAQQAQEQGLTLAHVPSAWRSGGSLLSLDEAEKRVLASTSASAGMFLLIISLTSRNTPQLPNIVTEKNTPQWQGRTFHLSHRTYEQRP